MSTASGTATDRTGLFWPLRTIGALSALVFVIAFCLEVMVAYQIKSREQHVVIAVLLLTLSAWALVEVRLIGRQSPALPIRWLRFSLLMQLVCVASRGYSLYFLPAPVEPNLYHLVATHGLATLFYPAAYVAIFLAVGNAIINLLLHNEQVRAGMLEELNRRLEIEATHDALTGLANRRVFRERITHEISLARRRCQQVAVVFLDLDGFKSINDRFGHEAGDVVLQAVSRRWKACIRDTDLLARFGGDEFAISIAQLGSVQAVESIAQALIDKLSDEVLLPDGRHCRVGVSAGISIYPVHGSDVDALLASADAAMYSSKKAGRNRYVLAPGVAAA